MMHAALDALSITFVLVQRHNGTLYEEPFRTRNDAELWLALLPILQLNGQHLDVFRTQIRPSGLGVN